MAIALKDIKMLMKNFRSNANNFFEKRFRHATKSKIYILLKKQIGQERTMK